MVTYKIHNPVNQNGLWVVDVSEHMGVGITRRTTIPLTVASRFIEAIFTDQPLKYKEIIKNG